MKNFLKQKHLRILITITAFILVVTLALYLRTDRLWVYIFGVILVIGIILNYKFNIPIKKGVVIPVITVILIVVLLILYAAIRDMYFSGDSQCVNLKYNEYCVNLSDFYYLNTDKSSFVNGAWYDEDNNHLILKLNEAYYEYCGFYGPTWNLFKNANSFGSHYNSEIKGRYSCSDDRVKAIESSLSYDICLGEAIEYSNNFLVSKGYTEQNDGYLANDQGLYLTAELEAEMEVLQTKVLFDCLAKYE